MWQATGKGWYLAVHRDCLSVHLFQNDSHVIPYKLCQSKYVHRRPSDVCHGEEAQCSRTKYQDPRWPSSILVQEQLSLSQPRKVSATYNNLRNVDTDSDNQNVSVDGHAIERMEEIKLLGVQINKKKIFPVKK